MLSEVPRLTKIEIARTSDSDGQDDATFGVETLKNSNSGVNDWETAEWSARELCRLVKIICLGEA